ncbi:MAG: segregation/condensation protein A, partial [Clostridiales bacterium]|nr:segregation/condensation protein A [Clostridiales bacterium]
LADMEFNPTRTPEVKKVYKEVRTVQERFDYINKLIVTEKEISFFSLFESDFTKFDIINTFLAVLELLKRQQITVVQEEIFGDIKIFYKLDRKEIGTLSAEEVKEMSY